MQVHASSFTRNLHNKMADNNADIDDVAAVLSVIAVLANEKRKKRKRKRSVWVQPWIANRQTHGAYHALLQELQMTDTKSLRNFLRMDMASFQLLLNRTGPLIARTDSNMRQCISPEERIALTLRYLATGEP